MSRTKRQQIIAASEVAEYLFCAKAWQLKRQGEIAESVHLNPGKEFHRRHSASVLFASQLRRAGVACIALALLLFILITLLRQLNTP
jgi:hypothetical protein